MEKEMLALVKLKEGEENFLKFMAFMQSEEGMAERGKFAIPPKTIAAVTPDKGALMFMVFYIFSSLKIIWQSFSYSILYYSTPGKTNYAFWFTNQNISQHCPSIKEDK